MRCYPNFNHDKFKKKAAEEEVDVSTLLCALIHRSRHLTSGKDDVHFRVNFNRLDVFIRNSVGAAPSAVVRGLLGSDSSWNRRSRNGLMKGQLRSFGPRSQRLNVYTKA